MEVTPFLLLELEVDGLDLALALTVPVRNGGFLLGLLAVFLVGLVLDLREIDRVRVGLADSNGVRATGWTFVVVEVFGGGLRTGVEVGTVEGELDATKCFMLEPEHPAYGSSVYSIHYSGLKPVPEH